MDSVPLGGTKLNFATLWLQFELIRINVFLSLNLRVKLINRLPPVNGLFGKFRDSKRWHWVVVFLNYPLALGAKDRQNGPCRHDNHWTELHQRLNSAKAVFAAA